MGVQGNGDMGKFIKDWGTLIIATVALIQVRVIALWKRYFRKSTVEIYEAGELFGNLLDSFVNPDVRILVIKPTSSFCAVTDVDSVMPCELPWSGPETPFVECYPSIYRDLGCLEIF